MIVCASGAQWVSRKYQLRLPPRSHEDLYVFVQFRTTEIFRSARVGAAQTKKEESGLNSGPSRPSAARFGNGASRHYAPLVNCRDCFTHPG
ncbi:hypothetical protein NL676_036882 [Syzygium grande]|nr:hypothetical protein NL676_036882 [Syzygium grande]